jgi:hypothetical protein
VEKKTGPRKKRAGSRIGMMDSRLCGAIYREVTRLWRSRPSLSLREKVECELITEPASASALVFVLCLGLDR